MWCPSCRTKKKMTKLRLDVYECVDCDMIFLIHRLTHTERARRVKADEIYNRI